MFFNFFNAEALLTSVLYCLCGRVINIKINREWCAQAVPGLGSKCPTWRDLRSQTAAAFSSKSLDRLQPQKQLAFREFPSSQKFPLCTEPTCQSPFNYSTASPVQILEGLSKVVQINGSDR